MQKGKCIVTAEIDVYTRFPNGRRKRDALENQVKAFLSKCYIAYMKALVSQIEDRSLEIVQLDTHNYDVRKVRRAK